jgi:hypothetical protein
MTAMLNTDIWVIVAENLRGDTSTLRACAFLSTVTCGSMQRELFRTITMEGQDPSSAYRLVQSLTARPSLASYIRRLEAGKVALKVLADFARPGPADVISRLARVRELRIVHLRLKDEALFRNMSGCFPFLFVLELYYSQGLPLWCIPTVFPALHALHLHGSGLATGFDVTTCNLDAGVPRLSLRTFSFTRCTSTRISPFVERCLSWERAECLGVHPNLIPSLRTSFRDSSTRLRHLFVQCNMHDHTTHKLEVQFPSCGM